MPEATTTVTTCASFSFSASAPDGTCAATEANAAFAEWYETVELPQRRRQAEHLLEDAGRLLPSSLFPLFGFGGVGEVGEEWPPAALERAARFNEWSRRMLNPSLRSVPIPEKGLHRSGWGDGDGDVCRLLPQSSSTLPTPQYCHEMPAQRRDLAHWHVSPGQHVLEWFFWLGAAAALLGLCRLYRRRMTTTGAKEAAGQEAAALSSSPRRRQFYRQEWFQVSAHFWLPLVFHQTIGSPLSQFDRAFHWARCLFILTPCGMLWILSVLSVHVLPRLEKTEGWRKEQRPGGGGGTVDETRLLQAFLTTVTWTSVAVFFADGEGRHPLGKFVWHGHHQTLLATPYVFLLQGRFSTVTLEGGGSGGTGGGTPAAVRLLRAAGNFVHWLLWGWAVNMIVFFVVLTPLSLLTGYNVSWCLLPLEHFDSRHYRFELASEFLLLSAVLRLAGLGLELARDGIMLFGPRKRRVAIKAAAARITSRVSLHRGAVLAGLALFAWVLGGTEWAAGGEYFVPVPLVGFLRGDAALPLLALEILAGAKLVRAARRRRWILVPVLAAAIFVLPLLRITLFAVKKIDPDWFEPPYPALDDIRTVPHAIAPRDVDRIVDFALRNQDRWTKVSLRQVLGNFFLGTSKSFDKATEGGRLYSLRHGWRLSPSRDTCLETDFVAHDFCAARQDRLAEEMHSELWGVLRKTYAAALGTAPERVVLGSEGHPALRAGEVGFPAVHAFLPNLAWQLVLNPHTDIGRVHAHHAILSDATNGAAFAALGLDVGRCQKSSYTSLLLPLTTPDGAGLQFWSDQGRIHRVTYELGSVYTFPAMLLHAVRPFSYREHRRREDLRLTVQAFAMLCGEKWHVIH